MGYNWLMRRNKAVLEELARFSNDLHGYMMSGGAVKPVNANRGGGAAAGAAAAGAARATSPGAASPGGTTATGSATGTTVGGPKKL
jgi:biopolymer transport protein ExbB